MIRKITFLIFGSLVFSLVFNACSSDKIKSSALKKKEIPYYQLDQEKKESLKAAKLKVKKRDTYSYFYNKYGKVDDHGYLVETVEYDEKGNLTGHLFYTSRGAVDRKYLYKYDDKGNLVENEAYDISGNLRYQQFSEYDDYGNIILAKIFNPKFKDYDKKTFEYDTAGNLLKTFYYNPEEVLTEKVVSEYDSSGLLLKKSIFAGNKKESETDYFIYDSLGNKIKEKRDIPGTLPKFYTFKYDKNNNLIEELSPIYIKKWAYDDDNNLTMEEIFDKDGYLQTRFQYFYDERGLLKEKIRYDGQGKPAIYVRYKYEFYN